MSVTNIIDPSDLFDLSVMLRQRGDELFAMGEDDPQAEDLGLKLLSMAQDLESFLNL